MTFTRAGGSLNKLAYSLAGTKYRELMILSFGWRSLLGDLLAERARIRKLSDQVLFVEVKNNVWMQELVLRKSELIKDIKLKFNISLKNIVFSLEWINGRR